MELAEIYRMGNYIHREACEYYDSASGCCLAKDGSVGNCCSIERNQCDIINKIVI